MQCPFHWKYRPPTSVAPDFHIALLWLRSVEILNGHSPGELLSELEMPDLFGCYRSPYKA